MRGALCLYPKCYHLLGRNLLLEGERGYSASQCQVSDSDNATTLVLDFDLVKTPQQPLSPSFCITWVRGRRDNCGFCSKPENGHISFHLLMLPTALKSAHSIFS